MPYKSRSQARFFFSAESRGELPKGTARRWAHHTPNIKKLPNKVRKRKKKAEAEPGGPFEGLGTIGGVIGGTYGGATGGGLLGGYLGQHIVGKASLRDIIKNRHETRGANLVAAKLRMDNPGKNVLERIENTVFNPSQFFGRAPGPMSRAKGLTTELVDSADALKSVRERFAHISRNANKLGLKYLKRDARLIGQATHGVNHAMRKGLGGALGLIGGGLLGAGLGGFGGGMAGNSLGAQLDSLTKASSEKQAIMGLMRGLGQAARTGFNAIRGAMRPAAQAATPTAKTMPVQSLFGQWANNGAKQITLPSGPWSNPVMRESASAASPGLMQTAGKMMGQVGAGIKSDISAMRGGVGRAIGYGLPAAGLGYLAAQKFGQPQQPQTTPQAQPQPQQVAQPQQQPLQAPAQNDTLAYRY